MSAGSRPEAPVPVVHVQRESSYPGGAANVARNLRPFTPHVSLMGLVGTDDFGSQLLQLLETESIDTAGVVRDERAETIVKTRIVARHQQVCRVDRESPMSLQSSQIDGIMNLLTARAAEIDAISPWRTTAKDFSGNRWWMRSWLWRPITESWSPPIPTRTTSSPGTGSPS